MEAYRLSVSPAHAVSPQRARERLGRTPWRLLLEAQDVRNRATPLHQAARYGHRLAVLEELLAHASRWGCRGWLGRRGRQACRGRRAALPSLTPGAPLPSNTVG